MRYSETFGAATRSGAKLRKSTASRSMIAIIGVRMIASYCALRGRNQSRALWRLSPRRNVSASGEKRRPLVVGTSVLGDEVANEPVHLVRLLSHDPVRAVRDGRLRRQVVAAHVGHHRGVIAAELGELVAPLVPEIGKAVQEDDERTASGAGGVQPDAVDVRGFVGQRRR